MPDIRVDPDSRSDPITLLAFDFGARRIGIAVGNALTGRARAIGTLDNRDSGPDWSSIDAFISEWSPDRLVVGMPYNMDGTEHALASTVNEFAAALADRTRLPVDFVDERLSSHEAMERLKHERQGGHRRRIRKEDVDSAAAAVILETWLNSHSLDKTP